MVTRSQLRSAAVAAFKAANTLAEDRVFEPRSWPTTVVDHPAIMVRTPRERRESVGRNGPPSFNSIVTLVAIGRVEYASEADAEEGAETLAGQMEDALLRNGQFIYANEIQQFAFVETQVVVSAEAKFYLGEASVAFGIEVYQLFEPTLDADGVAIAPPLEGIDVHADMGAPYDASGTYPAPTAPPYMPAPAPRSSGPDGRDEGAAQIDLPQ